MIKLQGVPITKSDARSLVTTLLAVDTPDTVSAARTIYDALYADADSVNLTTEQRDAVLLVLDEPPAMLAQLRGVLAWDHEFRNGPIA